MVGGEISRDHLVELTDQLSRVFFECKYRVYTFYFIFINATNKISIINFALYSTVLSCFFFAFPKHSSS